MKYAESKGCGCLTNFNNKIIMLHSEITINDLWEAGVHFGHKSSRWNPKMAPYIYGEKNGLHIIDLRQSLGLLQMAQKIIHKTVKENGRVLFVGTKIQASNVVAEYAKKCGQYFINTRWLGGTLTNWSTVSKSIKELEKIEKVIESNVENPIYTKKEILDMERKKTKLLSYLGGIRDMGGKPNLMIVLDTIKDNIAIEEAKKLDIPIIAITDSNSNPDNITHIIPGNDDAIKAITLYCKAFADSALAGIEEALLASGVDIGAMAENQDGKFKSSKKVTKIKQHKKINKSETVDVDTQVNSDFEKVLNAENSK
jgi:small subunit ribosomal protein S2